MSIESANEALFEEEEDDSIPLPVLEPIYEVKEKIIETPLIEPEVVKSDMSIESANEALFEEEEDDSIPLPVLEPIYEMEEDTAPLPALEPINEVEEEMFETPLIEPEVVKSDMSIESANEALFEEEEDDSIPLPVLEPIYEVKEKIIETPLIEPEVVKSDMSIESANEALFEEEEDDSIPLPVLEPIYEMEEDTAPLPALEPINEVEEEMDEAPLIEPEVVKPDMGIDDTNEALFEEEEGSTPLVLEPINKVEEKSNGSGVDIVALQSIIPPINLLFTNLGLDLIPEKIKVEGLDEIRFALAANVGMIPRDTRVDRLLRLALRLIPRGTEKDLKSRAGLIQLLAGSARDLDKWTDLRLRARGSAGKGKLLIDSRRLGKMLNRIPGPGTSIPLEKDTANLSSSNDIKGLATEVGNLCSISNLNRNLGVKAV